MAVEGLRSPALCPDGPHSSYGGSMWSNWSSVHTSVWCWRGPVTRSSWAERCLGFHNFFYSKLTWICNLLQYYCKLTVQWYVHVWKLEKNFLGMFCWNAQYWLTWVMKIKINKYFHTPHNWCHVVLVNVFLHFLCVNAKHVLGWAQECLTDSNRIRPYNGCVYVMTTKQGFYMTLHSFEKSVPFCKLSEVLCYFGVVLC